MSQHTTNGRARRLRRALAVAAVVALLGACGAGASEAPASTRRAPATAPRTTAASTPGSQDAESPASKDSGQQAAVAVQNFAFKPEMVTVKTGSTVVWTNEDSFAHTVTAGKRGAQTDTFDHELGELDTNDNAGANFSFTFEEPGSYPYFCRFHPTMRGTVEVR